MYTYYSLCINGICFAYVATDKIDLKYLNRWVKDKICEEGMNYLKELAGVLLPGGVGNIQIRIIIQDNRGDIKSCFTELIDEWRRREIDATWQKFIDALKDTNMPNLARDIENRLQLETPGVVPTQPQEGANQQVVLATQPQQAEQMKQPSVEGTYAHMALTTLVKVQSTLAVKIEYHHNYTDIVLMWFWWMVLNC